MKTYEVSHKFITNDNKEILINGDMSIATAMAKVRAAYGNARYVGIVFK